MSDEKTQEEIEADYTELKPFMDWLIEKDMDSEEEESAEDDE